MNIEKTTIGSYAAAAGIALGAIAAKLPVESFPRASYILGAIAAGFGALGMILLGTSVTDTSKTITNAQIAKLDQNKPITPRDLVKPDPDAAIKIDPPTDASQPSKST